MFLAAGSAASRSWSPSGNSRSLITSIRTIAISDLSASFIIALSRLHRLFEMNLCNLWIKVDKTERSVQHYGPTIPVKEPDNEPNPDSPERFPHLVGWFPRVCSRQEARRN